MAQLSGFPSAEVRFDKDANAIDGADDMRALAADQTITDLLVLSHGWNNDADDARRLFHNLTGSVRAVLDGGAVPVLADRHIGVVGVVWPSKKFSDSELIPPGAAATESPIDTQSIIDQINGLRDVFEDPDAQQTLDSVAALVPRLTDEAAARGDFADLLRGLLDPASAQEEDGPIDPRAISGEALMDRLAVPVSLAPPDGSPGTRGGAASLGTAGDVEPAAGGAAGLGSLLGGVLGAARNMLNYTTYYAMKARAGTIGERGLAPLVTRAHQARPGLRIHLAGHSFGGRLVSAAARDMTTGALSSLTLLQAAFSHYGLSGAWEPGKPGYFASVVGEKKVTGPILVTNTVNDKAVGIAYAIASRIARQTAAAVGDANDVYGGIGRNGAQRTDGTVPGELLAVRGDYTWHQHVAHNLRADKFISGHSDVTGKEVAHALLSALAST